MQRGYSIFIAVALLGCGDRAVPPPESSLVAYISPDGDDADPGTRAAPFRTVARGLSEAFDRLVLLSGVHTEGAFVVDRPVRLEGEGDAAIAGPVQVGADRVDLAHLRVDGGLEARAAGDLSIETATITAGSNAHALQLDGGSANLAAVVLECGRETCLFARGATLTVDRCRATATSSSTGRIFRLVQSRSVIRHTQARGGGTASFQIETGDAELADVSLIGGSNGLVALAGARVAADEVVVSEAARTSLLLQRVTASIQGGRLGATEDLTVGISGATVHLDEVRVEASTHGAISVSAAAGVRSEVELSGGVVGHGARAALLIDSGDVIILGTRFEGLAGAEGDDAITAVGPDASVTIEGATFEDSGGYGVALYGGARGTVSATIARPGLGGILVEGPTVAPVVIEGGVISGCRGGSGIDLQSSSGTAVRRVRVEGCTEAGILAFGADGSLDASVLIDNVQFGAAAFSGGVLTVQGSTISGSPFATFATCGDGGRVELLGDNRITGATTECP